MAVDLVCRTVLLEEILADGAVQPVFQPIVELGSGHVVAVEALARGPAGSPLQFPDALFSTAVEAGLLHELDTLCAARAMQAARRHRGELPPLLFINADPGAFTRPPTPELRAAIEDPGPYRTVLEFTERALASNPAGLLDVAHLVYTAGNGLALDDVGAEPLSLAFLPLIDPEVIKLDMHLLRDPCAMHTIDTAAGVGAVAERTGAAVVAEGVETEQDRATAVALGATWGQGWLFGRPGPLDALAGRVIAKQALVRARPGMQRPTGTPFTTAATGHPARRADAAVAAAFAQRLFRDAAAAGRYGVLLAMDHDRTGIRTWLPTLARLAPLIGFTALVHPPDAGDVPSGVHHAAVGVDSTGLSEAALVLVSPERVAALCIQRQPGTDDVHLITTHDVTTVLDLARMLLSHLGTRLTAAQGTHPEALKHVMA